MGCDMEYYLDHDLRSLSAADFLAEFKRRVAPIPVVLTGMDESPYANNAVPDDCDCWEIDCFVFDFETAYSAESDITLRLHKNGSSRGWELNFYPQFVCFFSYIDDFCFLHGSQRWWIFEEEYLMNKSAKIERNISVTLAEVARNIIPVFHCTKMLAMGDHGLHQDIGVELENGKSLEEAFECDAVRKAGCHVVVYKHGEDKRFSYEDKAELPVWVHEFAGEEGVSPQASGISGNKTKHIKQKAISVPPEKISVYKDMKNKFILCYGDDEFLAAEKITKIYKATHKKRKYAGFRYRLVQNMDALREKICIFEAGFDDRFMELLKVDLVLSSQKNKPKKKFSHGVFSLIPDSEQPEKAQVPEVTFFDDDGKKVFTCPLSLIPGETNRIKSEFDYSDVDSFIIDEDWAMEFITSERMDTDFFEEPFDSNVIDKKGSQIARSLLRLCDGETCSLCCFYLDAKELQSVLNQTELPLEDLRDSLKAFYRYTNFQTMLEDVKKPKFEKNAEGVYAMPPDEELSFLKAYFIQTAQHFSYITARYVALLVHGKYLSPSKPFAFGIGNREIPDFISRELGAFSFATKEEAFSFLRKFVRMYKGAEFEKSLKNFAAKFMYNILLPEGDFFKTNPSNAEKMLGCMENPHGFSYYDYLRQFAPANSPVIQGDAIKDYAVKVLKCAFEKRQIAACFEQIAEYFYRHKKFRESYYNQLMSCAYFPNPFGFMQIPEEYKMPLADGELKKYAKKYKLPLLADGKVEKKVVRNCQKCEKKGDFIGAVYFLNIYYNFIDEKHSEARFVDEKIDSLLEKISWE